MSNRIAAVSLGQGIAAGRAAAIDLAALRSIDTPVCRQSGVPMTALPRSSSIPSAFATPPTRSTCRSGYCTTWGATASCLPRDEPFFWLCQSQLPERHSVHADGRRGAPHLYPRLFDVAEHAGAVSRRWAEEIHDVRTRADGNWSRAAYYEFKRRN